MAGPEDPIGTAAPTAPPATAASTGDAPAPQRLSRYLFAIGLVVMLAGLLFGYDQGVISGALSGIDKSFHPSTLVIEIITSWVTLGAMAGALVAGTLTEHYGRRMSILLAAAVFVVGALLEALAPDTFVLVIGRLVLGAGVGVASVAAPLYGAENAPAHVRGRFVSLYQMAITIGIFLAYFADYLLVNGNAWRVMLGISAIPAVLLLLAVLPLGDTARWYLKMGRRAEAEQVLQKVNPAGDAAAEATHLQQAIAADAQATWREVFARDWRKPLSVAALLAVLQQLTGINAIIYYADTIFAAAGFNNPTSQSLATLWARRCRQRGGHTGRRALGRPLRPQAAAPPRVRGHVHRTAGRGRRLLRTAEGDLVRAGHARGRECRHPRPDRAGDLHRLIRLLAGTRGVDRHQ